MDKKPMGEAVKGHKYDKKSIVDRTMDRYRFLLESGHNAFVRKANACDGFFSGEGQWTDAERHSMAAKRKPALTLNQIFPTLSYTFGNQINNRVAATFMPRRMGATDDVANVLAKVYRQITDNNNLDWLRSEMFADGMITSRGFLDIRMDFGDSLQGEVRVSLLDPRQVLIDPDANSYDPSGWKDVITVQFLSVDDIELLWGKEKAASVRYGINESSLDADGSGISEDLIRSTFANGPNAPFRSTDQVAGSYYRRNIPVIEHQHRHLVRHDHFVWMDTGDMRAVPESMSQEEIDRYLQQNPTVQIAPRIGYKIRWTVVANNVLLHDEWSPYERLTTFPFFPMFRRGTTVGSVELLMDPQRLLNKTTSQELHILNTTSNSGWKVKRNNLSNMSIAELEQRGGETGLVIEVEDMDGLDKIQPNQVPTGLDRMAYKANEAIKEISLVSDYMRGAAREDVSAKSVVANQNSGATGSVKALDNLAMTDKLIAAHILNLIQTYYDSERVLRVVTDTRRQQSEDVIINQMTAQGVINDLTVGEYDIAITSIPAREMDEDNEFEQALRLRTEVGVQIPDDFLIRTSRLREKQKLLEQMAPSPDSTAAADQAAQAEAAKGQAELQKMQAETSLTMAKAHRELNPPQEQDNTQVELAKLKAEYELKVRELMMNMDLKEREMGMKREEMQMKMSMDQAKMAADEQRTRMQSRIDARKQAAAANIPKKGAE